MDTEGNTQGPISGRVHSIFGTVHSASVRRQQRIDMYNRRINRALIRMGLSIVGLIVSAGILYKSLST